MHKLFKRHTYFFMLMMVISSFTTAQSREELITAMNQHLLPLNTLVPGDDFSDLQKMKTYLQNKSIIGIGEATHGTHEFFTFKHRMLEFLVKELGIKTFVIEGDFSGTKAMDDYVVYGKGNVYKGLRGIGFGIWETQEFVDMANWVKAYNDTQSLENKVHFWGCDMQWGSAAIQELKNYLTTTNQFTTEMEQAFLGLKKFMPTISGQEKKHIRNAVIQLGKIEFTNEDTTQRKLYRHNVRQLQQYVGYMDAASTFYPAKQSDWRDKCMAENVEWIYEHTNHSKMLIWAHNAHISKKSISDGHQRMGMYLSKAFKDEYYALGFDFYTGQTRAFDFKVNKYQAIEVPPAKAGSSGAILATSDSSNFILDFKSASENMLIKDFLNKELSSLFLGAGYASRQNERQNYIIHQLASAYDGLIFIRETTAAKEIKSWDLHE